MSSAPLNPLPASKVSESVMKLVEMAAGYWLPRALQVVADLGVADALDTSPRLVDELAKDVGADADALDRVLRLLASHGVFERREGSSCNQRKDGNRRGSGAPHELPERNHVADLDGWRSAARTDK